MNKCSEWELNDIVSNLPYMDRNLWEIGRLQAYMVAQVNSKKKLQFSDICTFKWEEKESDESDYQISSDEINENTFSNYLDTFDEINRLKQIAKQWEN